MRKPTLATAVALLCSGSVHPALAQGISLGVFGGVNQSSVSSDVDQDRILLRSGLAVGAFLGFGSAGPVGYQIGASYTAKGFDIDTGQPGVSGGVKLTYLEVPLLLVVTIPTGPTSSVSPRIFAGGALAFNLGCSIVAEGMGVSTSVDCDQGQTGGTIKAFDAGAMFGGGLMIGAGPIDLLLDVSYTLGVLNINDTDSPDTIKNKNLSVSAGVVIPLSVARRVGL